jgi:hypothetical protein
MLQYLNQSIVPATRAVGERVILQNVSRRAFLKGTAWGTGAVFAATILPFNTAKAFEAYPHGGLDMPNGVINNPHVFVSIDPDGTVTIVAHRSEMGTGARTSLPMVIADEMEADWARVKIVQAPGDEVKYGNQDTDGSPACVTTSSRIASSAPRCARCCSRRRRSSGASTRARSRPSITRCCTRRPGASSATAISPRP